MLMMEVRHERCFVLYVYGPELLFGRLRIFRKRKCKEHTGLNIANRRRTEHRGILEGEGSLQGFSFFCSRFYHRKEQDA